MTTETFIDVAQDGTTPDQRHKRLPAKLWKADAHLAVTRWPNGSLTLTHTLTGAAMTSLLPAGEARTEARLLKYAKAIETATAGHPAWAILSNMPWGGGKPRNRSGSDTDRLRDFSTQARRAALKAGGYVVI